MFRMAAIPVLAFLHMLARCQSTQNNVKIDRRIRGSFYDPVRASSL
ncbi:hypothetical protein ECW26_24290 [Escherichia coli W26]|nr:hypothetical protein ECW26_24290 [Escherichia coli W26]